MNFSILVGEDGFGVGFFVVGFEFGVDLNEDLELVLVKFIKRVFFLEIEENCKNEKKIFFSCIWRKRVYIVMYIVCKIVFKL